MDIHPNANLRKQNGKILFITSSICFVSSTVILKFGRWPVSNNPDPFNQGASHVSNLKGQSACFFFGGGGWCWFGKEINKCRKERHINGSAQAFFTATPAVIALSWFRLQESSAVVQCNEMWKTRGGWEERDTAPLQISRASYFRLETEAANAYCSKFSIELPTAIYIYPLSFTITSVFNLWKSFSQSFSDKKLHTSLQKRQPVRNFKI